MANGLLPVAEPETVTLRLSDGIDLVADVYRPVSPGHYPVMLMRQPYGRAIASTQTLAHPAWYAAHGYVVVVQDVRGRGGSKGKFRLFRNDIEDGAATLTALTAAAVARIVPLLPRAPKTWIVAGGGARNPTLMRMLAQRLAPARVETGHEAGWSVDSLEAQAFAFLAVRSLRGLPITLPGTTGAPRPLTGGVLARP